LISKFYKYLKKLVDDNKSKHIKFLNVVGFNILRYDIPLLIQKGVEYCVASLRELNALWHSLFTIDYFQTSLPFHGMRFKGLKLELIAEWAKRAGVEIPEPYGSGKDVVQWFENKQYDDIIKHLESDLKITRVIDLNLWVFTELFGIIFMSTNEALP